jgi:hypothetical protein
MNEPVTRDIVLEEIKRIPDHKLPELYEVVHGFRLRLPESEETKKRIMEFAGCWGDLSEETLSSFLADVRQRRHQAFAGRRADEPGVD